MTISTLRSVGPTAIIPEAIGFFDPVKAFTIAAAFCEPWVQARDIATLYEVPCRTVGNTKARIFPGVTKDARSRISKFHIPKPKLTQYSFDVAVITLGPRQFRMTHKQADVCLGIVLEVRSMDVGLMYV